LESADEELEAERNLVGEIVGEIVGAEWYVHVLCARLDGVPSARWKPDAEGSLVFEESYVFSGDVYSGGQPQPLGISMPPLTCLPAEGAEESEARQVCGAVCSNKFCDNLKSSITCLRAGEHHVLQVLCAHPVEDAVLLSSSRWMPVLRGEARLFSGGLYFESAQVGPIVIPFRIHLAAIASYRLDEPTATGLVMIRLKPADHSYGPLSHLPDAPGGLPVDTQSLPLRSLALALVVPPRSSLRTSLVDIVWPVWEALFAECHIPYDELASPPAEFAHGLAVLRAA